MIRFRIAALASVLVIGAGTVGAGLTAASAATVDHVQNKPTKGEQALANHVPYADTCVGATASIKKAYGQNDGNPRTVDPRMKKLANSIVAAIKCRPTPSSTGPTGGPVPELVVFTQWKNVADMNAYYFNIVVDYNIQPNQGTNGQTTCPQEGGVNGGGKSDGRYVCQPKSLLHPADYVWTRKSLKIMGEAFLSNDNDGSVLYGWWTNGNPGPHS